VQICIANSHYSDYVFSMNALMESRAYTESLPYEPPPDERQLVVIARDGAHLPELYVAGASELLNRRIVAVVGSRKASPAGLEAAREVARELALAGAVVVSGLALGIDAAAHKAAIRAGGRTVAVIGTPLDRAYPPQNVRLQERIYREHLLVSPFARGTRTTSGHFPARNRIIARLTDATVLIEARERSGTIHVVREALACGRRVFVGERVLRHGGPTWVRSVVRQPGVVVWASPREVVDDCMRSATATVPPVQLQLPMA
jgi:DNA processing protein